MSGSFILQRPTSVSEEFTGAWSLDIIAVTLVTFRIMIILDGKGRARKACLRIVGFIDVRFPARQLSSYLIEEENDAKN